MAASHIASKITKSFKLVWDTSSDRSNPQMSEADSTFNLGGLQFHTAIVEDQDVPGFYKFNFSISDETLEALADGWGVRILSPHMRFLFDDGSVQHCGYPTLMAFEASKTTSHGPRFPRRVGHATMLLEIETKDVYLHRHYFLDEHWAAVRRTDCNILVEETPIFVNKELLAESSEYFKTLFFGDFKEKKENEIKLSNVTIVEFLEYLYRIYIPCRPFSMSRMGTVLKLADRFQNDDLLKECALLMANLEMVTAAEKCRMLEWADNYRMQVYCILFLYRMQALFNQIISTITQEEFRMLNPDVACYFTSENSRLVLKKFCK